MSRSIPQRNAASVLPEPVGARMRACWPAAMAGQPWAWGGVGAPKEVSNQARTGSEKVESGTGWTLRSLRDNPLSGSLGFAHRTGSAPGSGASPRRPSVALARTTDEDDDGH